MSLRVAKNRIELRVNGETLVVLPGKSYNFSAEDESTLDSLGALQPVEKVEQVKPVEAEEKPKRGRKKSDEEVSDNANDELDI